MKAFYYDSETGIAELRRDYPDPKPAPGEAMVRVRLAGVCNTDKEITHGYVPGYKGVLGHEFVGEVVAVNGDAGDWIGLRVVGDINVACGACHLCRLNVPTQCLNRGVLGIHDHDGALAEYVVLPVANLHRVPDDVTDHQAVFTEPLAAALQIVEQVHIRPTDRIVVLGDGKLGLLAAQVLALTGADVMAIGHNPAKLDILARRGIPAFAISRDATKATEQLLPYRLADVVVEATGRAEGLALARGLLRARGTLVLKSTFHGQLSLPLSTYVVDEVTLVGSRCGPFDPALRYLSRGLIDVTALIHAEYALDDVTDAFTTAFSGGVKTLVRV